MLVRAWDRVILPTVGFVHQRGQLQIFSILLPVWCMCGADTAYRSVLGTKILPSFFWRATPTQFTVVQTAKDGPVGLASFEWTEASTTKYIVLHLIFAKCPLAIMFDSGENLG